VFAALLAACNGGAARSGGGEGGHDPGKGGPAPAETRPTLAITQYEDGLELFMEYPALVAGRPSPLVAHLTDARDPEGFVPITKGRAEATLRMDDGTEETFRADAPVRDAIYKPVVVPGQAGPATLVIRLESEEIAGALHVDDVVVYPTEEAAAAAQVTETPGEPEIPFLKETQWKTRFATAPAEVRALQESVSASAEIKPVAGQIAEVAAPVGGRVVVTGAVPHLGQRIAAGQLVASIVPVAGGSAMVRAQLEADLARARAELELARRNVERAESLVAQDAAPARRLDEARAAREQAQAAVDSAHKQLASLSGAQSGGRVAGGAYRMRAPISGVVWQADLVPGAVVEAGRRLVSLVNTDRVWLEARVFETDVPRVENAASATFSVAGLEREFVVEPPSGRRVAVGAMLDPATRTLPLLFELPNPRGVLKPGMYAKASLRTGRRTSAVAVPESALVDDNGQPVVFVMRGGESFAKRRVRTGVRSEGFVQVLDGAVREGERVVTRGAYEIKLSTAAGAIPEHGHVH